MKVFIFLMNKSLDLLMEEWVEQHVVIIHNYVELHPFHMTQWHRVDPGAEHVGSTHIQTVVWPAISIPM